MRTLVNPIFLGYFVLASAVYMAGRMQLSLPDWISFYLNDFLCMPLVFTFILAVIRHLKTDPKYQLPVFSILSLTSYYIWFFEIYLPKHNLRYTADWLDALLYCIGSFLFYIAQKRQII